VRGPPIGTLSTPTSKAPDWLPAATFLAFLATLPLAWMTVTPAGGGFIKPFHVAALPFVAACLIRWRPRGLILPIWHRHAAIFVSYFTLLAFAFAAGLLHRDPFLPRMLVIRQAYYAAPAVIVAGFLYLVIGGRGQKWLAWSGTVTATVLIAAFSAAAASQHTNPIKIIGDALSQRDPNIITYRLLRSTFRTDTGLAETAANLRHKVFIALLISAFLGLACVKIIDRSRRVTRGTVIFGSLLGFALVVLSLSRSTILCLAVTLLLYPLRILVRGRARPRQLLALGLVGLFLIAALVSPVGDLLITRFSATGSYESRVEAAGPGFVNEFLPATFVGARRSTVAKSPHNFVLHSWLAGGIAAALAAAVILVRFAWLWLREARLYLTSGPEPEHPVGRLWVLGIGTIPLVRAFTAGNQLHMVEWTAIGLFLGLTAIGDRSTAAGTEATEVRVPVGSARGT